MPESHKSKPMTILTEAQLWLQSALTALQCGADPEQAVAQLLKAEQHLNKAAQTSQHLSGESSPIRFGVKVDRGRRHQDHSNEDSFFAATGGLPWLLPMPFGLFVVADGMGGHDDGQMASRIAVQRFVDLVLPGLISGKDPGDSLLIDGVQAAHQGILQGNLAMGNMGSVFTAALVIDATAYIVNVGDSRVYLYRLGEGLRQITQDHSVVAELVAAGKVKAEHIYTHPLRNQVSRSLGDKSRSEVLVDRFSIKLLDGDKLLLCCDGVWEMVRDQEIEKILRLPARWPTNTAHMLYTAAMKGGGEDNITAIVVEYGTPIADMETLSEGVGAENMKEKTLIDQKKKLASQRKAHLKGVDVSDVATFPD